MKKGDLIKHPNDKVLGVIVHVFRSKELKGLVEVVWSDGFQSDIQTRYIEVINDENR